MAIHKLYLVGLVFSIILVGCSPEESNKAEVASTEEQGNQALAVSEGSTSVATLAYQPNDASWELEAVDLPDATQLVALPPIALTPNANRKSAHASIEQNGDVLTVTVNGKDPWFKFDPITETYDAEVHHLLTFEYTSEKEGGPFEVWYGHPLSRQQYCTFPMPSATEWKKVVIDLKKSDAGFTQPYREFRLDTGKVNGNAIELRNFKLESISVAMKREMARKTLQQVQASGLPVGVQPKTIEVRKMPFKTVEYRESQSETHVQAFEWHLDLDAKTKRRQEFANDIPFAPPIVAGQGAHSENHTVVRILSQHSLNEVQFLAYPHSVKGGVDVATAVSPDSGHLIVTAPLLDETVKELRIFSRYGALLRTLQPSAELSPPYAMAAGELMDHPGDEIAVTSRLKQAYGQQIFIYSFEGELLKSFLIPSLYKGEDESNLSIHNQELIYFSKADGVARVFGGAEGFKQVSVHTKADTSISRVYPSVFSSVLLGVDDDAKLSYITGINYKHNHRAKVNAATRENKFYLSPWKGGEKKSVGLHAAPAVKNADFSSGKYIQTAHTYSYGFIRPHWFGFDANWKQNFASYESAVGTIKRDVDERLAGAWTQPMTWAPLYSQRWKPSYASHLSEDVFPGTSKPIVGMYSRYNEVAGYSEGGRAIGQVSFNYYSLPDFQKLVFYPLRYLNRRIANEYRDNIENFILMDSTHEIDVTTDKDGSGSVGDYNPYIIREFYEFTHSHFGSLEAINQHFGANFTDEFFDAPRDIGRGSWDRYDTSNPFFLFWDYYNRYTVYRTICDTFSETLLAGFPPECITAHQIPDLFASGSLDDFSAPAERISPIDALLNIGTGFGFTRYNLWYQREHTALNYSYTSGFDMIGMGEYAPKTTSVEDAYHQFLMLREQGAFYLNLMAWNPDLYQGRYAGMNIATHAAWEQLVAQKDEPRISATGGIGRVVPYQDQESRFNLVSLGSLERNTGLIKSLNQQCKWDGQVYVVPFHSHVELQPLTEDQAFSVGGADELKLNLGKLSHGTYFDCSFAGKAAKPTVLTLQITESGNRLPDQVIRVDIGAEEKSYRINYKFMAKLQNADVIITADSPIELSGLSAYRHHDASAKSRDGKFTGIRHRGGVSFDVF